MATSMAKKARAAKSGDAVGALLNREPAKKKTAVKDHAAANRAMLRAVAAENRAIAADAAEEANREAFKMNRFKGVESVVFKDNPTRDKHVADGDQKEFLKRGTRQAKAEAKAATAAPRAVRSATKPSVPRAAELAAGAPAPRDDAPKNFIRDNVREAVQSTAARTDNGDKKVKNENYGKVPAYLLERKLEWAEAEEAKRQAAAQSDVPPGMIRLTEEKRLEMLNALKASQAQIINDLARFPLTVETASRRRAKDELESKLREVEAAIDKFNKKVVYITA